MTLQIFMGKNRIEYSGNTANPSSVRRPPYAVSIASVIQKFHFLRGGGGARKSGFGRGIGGNQYTYHRSSDLTLGFRLNYQPIITIIQPETTGRSSLGNLVHTSGLESIWRPDNKAI